MTDSMMLLTKLILLVSPLIVAAVLLNGLAPLPPKRKD